MTKLKIGILAATLALASAVGVWLVISKFGYDGFGSRACLVLIYPAAMLGGLLGLVANKLFGQSGTEVILTPVFICLWFFSIYWVIFSWKKGHHAA
jgi:hypothetical protein